MAEMPGVQKRFSDKQGSKRVRFKGSDHGMHRKDGVEGSGGKDGKVKFADMGETWGKAEMPGSNKNQKHYPSLRVNADQLPDLKNHKVGDEVCMSVKATLKSAEQRDGGDHHFTLEVKQAAVAPKKD